MFSISANYNVGKYFLFKNLFTAEACYDQSVPQAFCNCQILWAKWQNMNLSHTS